MKNAQTKINSISMSLMSFILATQLISITAFASDHLQIIESRQEAFNVIEQGLEEIEEQLDSDKIHWQAIKSVSVQLVEHASVLEHSFPEGTGNDQLDDTRAKKSIWQDSVAFNRQMVSLTKAIELINIAVEDKNKQRVFSSIDDANTTCRRCHMEYRSLW